MSDLTKLENLFDQTELTTVELETKKAVKIAEGIVVTDQTSYTFALELVQECKKRVKAIEDRWGDKKTQAHKLWKSICDLIAEHTKPLEAAAKVVTKKAYDWQAAERKRLEIEAEKKRAEEQRRIEDERLKQAETLAQAGDKAGAEAVLDEHIFVPVEEIKEPVKPEAVGLREKWAFEIVDVNAIPREYLMPNTIQIGQIVRAMKGATNIPGIRVYDEGTISVRSKS